MPRGMLPHAAMYLLDMGAWMALQAAAAHLAELMGRMENVASPNCAVIAYSCVLVHLGFWSVHLHLHTCAPEVPIV